MPLPWLRAFVRLSLLAGALLLGACGEEEQAQQVAPPPAVMVASVEQQDVTPSVTFNGRIEAVDTVDLRARVEGFIEQRRFKEGDDVKAGELLFMLEKAPYEAEIKKIQGQITAAKGTLRLAQIEVDRREKLVKRKLVAQAELDQAEAKHVQALGELQRLRAILERAKLDLGYTDITAPIDGKISRSPFSVGDFVTPSSDPLATIVSQDPMYVSFPVSARQLLEVRRTAETRGRNPRAVAVKVRLPDGSTYGETGTINFVDVQADPTTDTVTVRATIPNPQQILVAAQLVGVIVEQERPEQALVIPQAAIAVDQAGPYVLVVNKESKAEQRRIRTGSPQGSGITVTEGLRKGEQVIVEGLQKVRPGQVVAASEAKP
ncbi:efflux transporter, RND family, MFP subunit [Nitrosococcus halophilus Nc 4]|uniref:Efflux transporter, RND family, MFP subunit n=2 Tax=Nitrosococcus halophilus TaxID=133539 RepID=D5C2Y5_NITHN|nr:efflux transporter, RND family, MFP subunit [Nitrosococcus halophilus Nc 4]